VKKQKFPKYIQNLFKKPQFQVGDRVKYNFLGEGGWGVVTKINQSNEKITYMVKEGRYTYPCGLMVKEYSSYYAGHIFYQESKDGIDKGSNGTTRSTRTKKQNDNTVRMGSTRSNGDSVSNESGSRSRRKDDNRPGNAKHISTNTTSSKETSTELEDAIEKQKNFLRKFSK
jgi:hypothetical protein